MSIPSLPLSTQTQILDLLFEPSPELHSLFLPLLQQSPLPFDTYTSLIETVRARLIDLLGQSMGNEEVRRTLDGILNCHPRLGEKKTTTTEGKELSEASKREQEAMRNAEVQLGLDETKTNTTITESLEEKLWRLNMEYEERFGGLRYTTFVNGRPRPIIMDDMEMRIKRGDLLREKRDAIDALCDIARDRAGKMGESP